MASKQDKLIRIEVSFVILEVACEYLNKGNVDLCDALIEAVINRLEIDRYEVLETSKDQVLLFRLERKVGKLEMARGHLAMAHHLTNTEEEITNNKKMAEDHIKKVIKELKEERK